MTAHGKIAIETSNDHKVLDRLTANGKQSENASGEIGHEHHPTVSGPYDPSLLLQPKLGKPGRIANGSRPPKTLSTHHLAERAVMRGRADRGRGRAGSRGPPRPETPGTPAPEGAEETKFQRAPEERPVALPSSHWQQVEREERKPHGKQHQVHPEAPPLSSHPSEGRASGCVTFEEVPARGKEFDTEGRKEPEGLNNLYVQHKNKLSKRFPLCQRPNHTDITGKNCINPNTTSITSNCLDIAN